MYLPFVLVSEIPEAAARDLLDTIINILNCDLHKLKPRILAHYFHTVWSKSLTFLSYKHCYHSQGQWKQLDILDYCSLVSIIINGII